jgi:hypothetical protein
VTARYWFSFVGVYVFVMAFISVVGPARHRSLFVQSLNEEEAGDEGSLYFAVSGFRDETLSIFPASGSQLDCQAYADYMAHGDGAVVLTQEGFSTVECGTHEEKIDTNEHPLDNGATGENDYDPIG